MRLFLCEKPSQAKDIAAVLGNPKRGNGHYSTDSGTVTWCFGHLLELAQPHEYDAKWQRWSVQTLPIAPERFRSDAKKDAKEQLHKIGGLLKRADEVVVATDADREGEMIAREVMDHFAYKGAVKRLWLSALDPESIRKGLSSLKDGKTTLSLHHAASARSHCDWLVGINMTRAFTCLYRQGRETLNIGRVQTPTLALVVRRDREIAHFKPRDYFAIEARVSSGAHPPFLLRYDPRDEDKRLWSKSDAESLVRAIEGQSAPLTVTKDRKKSAPPKLFSLSGLQKKANSLWGFSADKTLKIAQSLYETHKLTTYPRSDCVYLPEEQIEDVPKILSNLARMAEFREIVPQTPVIRKTVFNTGKVTAHHAIIPTKTGGATGELSKDEGQLFRLICQHYLASLLPDFEYEQTDIKLPVGGIELSATGKIALVQGWRVAFRASTAQENTDEEQGDSFPPVQNGDNATVQKARAQAKQTKPPAHYTEGTLIADMMAVGKYVTDPAQRAKLKETSGIGTEATRAATIAGLRDKGFFQTKGKKILATEKANRMYDKVMEHLPELADAGETAQWEDKLEAIVEGRCGYGDFMGEMTRRVTAQVTTLRGAGDATATQPQQSEIKDTGEPSWHPGHTGESIGESADFWQVPGYGRLYKDIAKRPMTLDDYRAITASKDGASFDGFVSKKGTRFSARLVFNARAKPYPKIQFKFDESASGNGQGESTGEKAKVGRTTAEIVDNGDYFTVKGVKGRLFKKIAGRSMSAKDYADLLASPKGVTLSGFVSKKGNPFSARLVFNAKAKPFPKVEFQFD
jgi:DNA topoisomerase-3